MESVREFEAKIRRLEKLAKPTSADEPFFNECMERLQGSSVSYKEALEYVIRERNGGAD